MKIGVLGTGMVGHAIGSRLIRLGHEVKMGARTADNERAAGWVAASGKSASQGTFAETAAYADEIVFNCTKGEHALEVMRLASAANLSGKILIDVSNPLDFSKGMPPVLSICNDNSLGEEIQKMLPSVKVIKALNTMNCEIMLNPARIPGKHTVFVSGNDKAAKDQVRQLLQQTGWAEDMIIDLGDISTARGTEMLLPIWLRLWGALGTAEFNFHINR